jgi:hypothetical protein
MSFYRADGESEECALTTWKAEPVKLRTDTLRSMVGEAMQGGWTL